MNLAECLQQIRNFNMDAGPFLEACQQGRDLILKGSQEGIPDDAKEYLANLVSQIDKERAEFVRLFDSGITQLKKDLGSSCDTIASQMVTRENQLLEIRKLVEQIEAIPIPPDDAKHNPFHSDNLVASVPSLEPSLPKTADVAFSDGQALTQTVLNLKSVEDMDLDKASRSPRISGNIWENWTKSGE